jgi:hypothetical protein
MQKHLSKIISTLLLLVLLAVSVVGSVTVYRTSHANTGYATIDKMTADQLGDALVRALADRYTYEVKSDELQAQVDDLKDKFDADIQSALNEKVQCEFVRINPEPIFKTGKSKGTLMIVNNKTNKYSQQVEIYTDDNSQLIYSGDVEVGQKIETDTLLVDLPKGVYNCTAYFTATNPETGGGIRAEMTGIRLTIQE